MNMVKMAMKAKAMKKVSKPPQKEAGGMMANNNRQGHVKM